MQTLRPQSYCKRDFSSDAVALENDRRAHIEDTYGIITINAERDGVACVRGLGIKVDDIATAVFNGSKLHEILQEFDGLTRKDLQAVLKFLSNRRTGYHLM